MTWREQAGSVPEHGTRARYRSRRQRRRCELCVEANRAAVREYRSREGVKEREAAASARYRAARPKPERKPPSRAQPTLRQPDFVGTITLEEYRRWRS